MPSSKEVLVGPTRSAPSVDLGREFDGDGPVFGLGLSHHGFEEPRRVTLVIATPHFNDACQERNLALVILPTLYAAIHHPNHSIPVDGRSYDGLPYPLSGIGVDRPCFTRGKPAVPPRSHVRGVTWRLFSVRLCCYLYPMRTATDFNEFYKIKDPWSLTRAKFRDRVFRKQVSSLVRGRSVLELGCGEGHLTQAVFGDAKSIVGIDISDIAIERAKKRSLANAQFKNGDILEADFTGHDLITAIECIYYLSPDEQERFFVKIAKEHSGRMLLLSAPIIGENRFRAISPMQS